jgi:hypothetical protein
VIYFLLKLLAEQISGTSKLVHSALKLVEFQICTERRPRSIEFFLTIYLLEYTTRAVLFRKLKRADLYILDGETKNIVVVYAKTPFGG